MWTVNNINITLSEDVARWLWIKAAEEDRSVSEWVVRLVEKAHRRHHDYRVATQMLLTGTPGRVDWPSERGYTARRLPDRPGKEFA